MRKKQSIYFCIVHCLLLVILLVWLYQQNKPVHIAQAQQTATSEVNIANKLQCVSYAPYYGKGQSPLVKGMWIEPAQIEQDLLVLSKTSTCVRTYSVGQGLDYVPEAAKKMGMQVYLGAWIGWSDQDNIKEIRLAAQIAENYPEVIKGLIVGNEVLLRQEQTPQSMQAYLTFAKTLTTVPITYADVWEFWLQHKAMEAYVDFHTVHILPYWEDDPKPISMAALHVDNVMAKMTRQFDKPILIGETGWPSKGRQRHASLPSLVNQAHYIHAFLLKAEKRQWQYNIIEAIDQPWKRKQEGTVGGYWGLLTPELSMKYTIGQDVAERQDGLPMALVALLSVVILAVLAIYLEAKTLPIIIGISAIGLITGVMFVLQWDYLWAVCTNTQEWLALSSVVFSGGLLSFLWPIHLFAPGQHTARIHTMMKWLSMLMLFAALYASYYIYMDGRYRNFPIVLFIWPATLLFVNNLFEFKPIKVRWPFVGFVGVAAVLLALLCFSYEPDNNMAALWIVISLYLAFSNWPEKLTLRFFNLKLF